MAIVRRSILLSSQLLLHRHELRVEASCLRLLSVRKLLLLLLLRLLVLDLLSILGLQLLLEALHIVLGRLLLLLLSPRVILLKL